MRRIAVAKAIGTGIIAASLFFSCATPRQAMEQPAARQTLGNRLLEEPPMTRGSEGETPAKKQAFRYEKHELGKTTIHVVIIDPQQVRLRVEVPKTPASAAEVAKQNRSAVAVMDGPYWKYFGGKASPHLYLRTGSENGHGNVTTIATRDGIIANIEALFVLDSAGAKVLPVFPDGREINKKIRKKERLNREMMGRVYRQLAETRKALGKLGPDALAMQTGPWLIRNGRDVTKELREDYPNSRHVNAALNRTLLGITTDGNILMVTTGGASGLALGDATGELAARYGLQQLVDLDGGPLVQMTINIGGMQELVQGAQKSPALLVAEPKENHPK